MAMSKNFHSRYISFVLAVSLTNSANSVKSTLK